MAVISSVPKKNPKEGTWSLRLATVLVALGGSFSSESHAIGIVGLESSNFLRSSKDRSNENSTVYAGIDYETSGKLLEVKLNVTGYTFLSDPSFFTAESRDFYVQTHPNHGHQVTLGRKFMSWGSSDDVWKQGLWAPRFLWDPTHPQPVGLTGVFYTYRASNWGVRVFASPLNVPERGFPIKDGEGRLDTPSPFLYPLPKRAVVLTQQADIKYAIAMPPLGQLIFNPGGAISLDYGEKEGIWAKTSYGFLPSNQPDISVEAQLQTDSLILNSTLHPRVYHHHILTGEVGYRAANWSAWGSLSGEAPVDLNRNPNFINEPMGPAIIYSTGVDGKLDRNFSLQAAFMYVNEVKPAADEEIVDLDIPTRFTYTNALMLGAKLTTDSPFSYSSDFTYDIENRSHIFSLDAQYAKNSWRASIGLDFFVSTTGQGIIGQYSGNDRLRLGVAYVF
ncbi:MAG: hypothetical protein AB7P04_04205 [Bacteriovoracia bacterium]